MGKNKTLEPIPEHFKNLEDASEFWDTHDAGDYEKYLRPIDEQLEFTKELPQAVLLERALSKKLKEVAQHKGVSLETLVNLWLREKLISE